MHSPAAASLLACLVLLPFAASAQDQPPPPSGSPPATPKTPERQDAAAGRKLEEEITKDLERGGGRSAAPAASQPAPGASARGGTGGNPMARLLLLPDISAIGDFAGVYDSRDVETLSPRAERDPKSPAGKPRFLFQELELGFQSVIDPYARADVFVSFEEAGVNVEEAYLTTLGLPAGLQMRAGKFRSPVGRLNQEHPHVWDFIDAPLALARIVSSAEALLGPGLDISWLAPLPWFAELHGAVQSTVSEFAGAERLTGIAHLQQFFQLGEGSTLGVGLSAARVDEAGPAARRDVGAAALYLKIRPVTSRAYVALQSELFGRRATTQDGRSTGTGGYVQGLWRRGAHDAFGVRYDWAPGAASGTERRVSGLFSWFPSEFQKLRLQVAWDRLPDGTDGLEAILHLELVIGAHGAHPF